MTRKTLPRRDFLTLGAAALLPLAAPQILRAQEIDPSELVDNDQRRNASSFTMQNWQDHFDKLGIVTIVADTTSRALHYWNEDGSDYRMYPTSVPLTESLTRRGYTKVVRKKVGPDWTPTESMMERDPSLHYMPPGPGNPLGTHALYLDWPAYLIHGTHDTRKIGRRSSSGCIGLYNNMIAELFEITPVGAQVRLI
jgi:lipoprotein-anchoring transpeptidase ErfK/SrfK